MKKVPLTDYFAIKSPLQSDKINFDVVDIKHNNSMPFLGRSANNNGIVDYALLKENLINEGKTISIALDGSTGSTFYQHHKFYSGQNIWLLEVKREKVDRLNHFIFLYLITTIRKAVVNYSYNLSLTKTRLNNIEIFLPITKDEKIDVDYIEKEMKKLRNIDLLNTINEDRYI
jgi:hypothetical protein